MKELTEKQMTQNCPECNCTWQGRSYFDVYREAMDDSVSDDEIHQHIAKLYNGETHQSRLMRIINDHNTKSVWLCPHCLVGYIVND